MLDTVARQWHIEQLEKMIDVLAYLTSVTAQADATRYRDGGTGWTVLEVMGHLYDYEPIALERLHVTVEQEQPTLVNFNADELAAATNHNARELRDLYSQWAARRQESITYLHGLPEVAFERVGIHPKRGPMTLDDQLMLVCWHDVNHLRQITQILTGREG